MRATRNHWHFLAGLIPAIFLAQALWVPAKAELAQWLLWSSWEKILDGAAHAPPWPWADTQPTARLFVPSQGIEQLVLAGDSGRNLAFGPALHGDLTSRDRVISGHRDTHFSFLRNLEPGDEIILESMNEKSTYIVAYQEIIDTNHQELVIEPGVERLSLVTCYPFDSVDAGGPLRFVITAIPAL